MTGVKVAGMLLLSCMLSACGDELLQMESQVFTIEMQGVFISPPDAVGTQEPIQQNYVIENVELVDAEGERHSIYDDDAKTFSIVSRPQIVFEEAIKDLEGQSFTQIVITIDETVATQTANGEMIDVLIPNPALIFNQAITIPKGKSLVLQVDVQWKDTVYFDADGILSATAPAFSMSLN